METVALQLLFGSDPYREAYLINRARRIDAGEVKGFWANSDTWNVLYLPPVIVTGRQRGGAKRRTRGGYTSV